MNRFIILCVHLILVREIICRPNPGPFAPNIAASNTPPNYGLNSLSNPVFGNQNGLNNINPAISNEGVLNRNAYLPNAFSRGNANLAELNNDAILSNNLARNIADEMAISNPAVNNLQVTPFISEVVPSLQCGDITMTGDLPIGGTIRVCGCFPVYGMVAVEGNVPSSGTAVVDESFGNQVIDIVSKCANEYFC